MNKLPLNPTHFQISNYPYNLDECKIGNERDETFSQGEMAKIVIIMFK